MSSLANALRPRAVRQSPAVHVLGALLAAAFLGLVASSDPVAAVALGFGLVLVAASLLRPSLAIYAFCFLLYSNAVTVAVRFHGVPFALGALFPAVLFVPLWHHAVVRREGLLIVPALPWIAVFASVMCLGTVFARDPAVALGGLREFLLEGVLLFFLVTNAVRTREALRRLTWALLLAGLLLAAGPLYQQLTGSFHTDLGGFGQLDGMPFRDGRGGQQQRLAGAIGETNRYAQLMLVLFPLAVFTFLHERSRWLRALALGCAAALLAGFALAFSRGGAVGAALLFAAMLALRVFRLRQALGVAAVGVLVLAATPQYLARLLPVADFLKGEQRIQQADGAIRGRVTEMLAAWRIFAEHPVVGVGPEMFPHYSRQVGNTFGIRRLDEPRQAHSLPLQVAAENGALGLAAFAAIVAVSLGGLLRARRRWLPERPERARLSTAYLLALVAYLGPGMFLHLSYVRYFWFLLALAAVAAAVEGGARPAAVWRRLPAARTGAGA